LFEHIRRATDPAGRLRAHILLLFADDHPWSQITAMLLTSPRTISRGKQQFDAATLAKGRALAAVEQRGGNSYPG
jgi:hypothetical protein